MLIGMIQQKEENVYDVEERFYINVLRIGEYK